MSETQIQRITIIGFGEVGGIFAADLASAGVNVSVFDFAFSREQVREAMLAKARAANVRVIENLEEAVRDAELVISAVTASSAAAVAKEAARFLHTGQFYMDTNSVSPETKREMAEDIAESGADFVESAIVAAVAPQRLKTPMLLGGPRAAELAKHLQSLGMDATAVSDRVGVASAIKMCRSVMMKGLAALIIESLFAARRYGAEDAVIASFEATYPGMGWAKKLPEVLIGRAFEHTRRRVGELREAAETVRDAGMNPVMSSSAAKLQEWLTTEIDAGHIEPYKPGEPFSWRALADATANSEAQLSGSLKKT